MVAPTHQLPRHDLGQQTAFEGRDVLGRIGTPSLPQDRIDMPQNRVEVEPAMETADVAVAGRITPVQSPRGIDRRIFPRKDVEMRVSGKRLDHTVEARRDPVLTFKTRDVSVGGLRAVSQCPLKVGERVSVFFPPEGASRGWDAIGRVVRIEPSYANEPEQTVAVEFDPLMAA